jgi:hypothetical protein|tara:strand:+ start:404 stop:592 length:189 start_codon:yes stop_codon:yes gene_type:complete
MKKNIISILFCIMLLAPSCASSKPTKVKKVEKKEIVSGEKDPLMKLLLSGLIILSINFLTTK